jgi:GH18 family chitinase
MSEVHHGYTLEQKDPDPPMPLRPMPRLLRALSSLLVLLFVVFVPGCGVSVDNRSYLPRLVGYLPDYDGSYSDFASTVDFSRLTHLILSVDISPSCSASTANGSTSLSYSQSNADIAAIVTAAHRHGVKVLVTFYGDSTSLDVQNCYDNGHTAALVDSMDLYARAHSLDGVDLDIEDPDHLGKPYDVLATALETRLHAEGKIVTAAVSTWIQSGMLDSTLHSFDFINMMNYSTLADAEAMLDNYHNTHGEPASKIVLGVGFFGTGTDDATTESYRTILSVYPDAWKKDYVSGGKLDSGMGFHYTGEASMAQQTKLGKQYGGIMIWELAQDASKPHALLDVIEKNL